MMRPGITKKTAAVAVFFRLFEYAIYDKCCRFLSCIAGDQSRADFAFFTSQESVDEWDQLANALLIRGIARELGAQPLFFTA